MAQILHDFAAAPAQEANAAAPVTKEPSAPRHEEPEDKGCGGDASPALANGVKDVLPVDASPAPASSVKDVPPKDESPALANGVKDDVPEEASPALPPSGAKDVLPEDASATPANGVKDVLLEKDIQSPSEAAPQSDNTSEINGCLRSLQTYELVAEYIDLDALDGWTRRTLASTPLPCAVADYIATPVMWAIVVPGALVAAALALAALLIVLAFAIVFVIIKAGLTLSPHFVRLQGTATGAYRQSLDSDRARVARTVLGGLWKGCSSAGAAAVWTAGATARCASVGVRESRRLVSALQSRGEAKRAE